MNTPEYMDFVGADGSWRGDAGPPRAGAAFVRRWSVVPLAGDPLNTLVITVSVRPLSEASRGSRCRVERCDAADGANALAPVR